MGTSNGNNVEIPLPAEATCPFVTGDAGECLTAYARSVSFPKSSTSLFFFFNFIKYFIDDYFIGDVQLLVKHPYKTVLFYFSSLCRFSL